MNRLPIWILSLICWWGLSLSEWFLKAGDAFAGGSQRINRRVIPWIEGLVDRRRD